MNDFKNYNMFTLKSICKTCNMKNYSKLNKTDLIKHIKKNLKGGVPNSGKRHSWSPKTVTETNEIISNITLATDYVLKKLSEEDKNKLIDSLKEYYKSYSKYKCNVEKLEKDEVINNILNDIILYSIYRYKLYFDLASINYKEKSCVSLNNSLIKEVTKSNIIDQKTCILWLYVNNYIFFYKVIMPNNETKYNVLTNEELKNYLDSWNKKYTLENILKNNQLLPMEFSKNNPYSRASRASSKKK